MTQQEVRYCYALDKTNNLINIKNACEMDGTFMCPHCKSEMIKKCGKHNAWHFAHKTKKCSYDKYLHTVAEQRIMEWFNEAEKIMIEIPCISKCPKHEQCKFKDEWHCVRKIHKFYDLKQWFSHAEQEKAHVINGEKYIADIMCHSRKENNIPLFLEICVTHRCEQKKIDSGIKIIEFDINSEDDIDAIIGSTIREKENIHFYNFHPKNITGSENVFEKWLRKFVLYPSMKYYFISNLSCHKFEKKDGIFEITTDYLPYEDAIAITSNYYPIKHCMLCKYSKNNTSDNSYICALYKKFGTHKYCSENDPTKCSYFRKNETLIRQKLEVFNALGVDIWKKG